MDKEKKYLYEKCRSGRVWYDKVKIYLTVLGLLFLIGTAFMYIETNEVNGAERYYDESKYVYLEQVAKDICDEEAKIDLTKIPKDVTYDLKTEDDGKIILSLLADEDKIIAPVSHVNVELTNKFELKDVTRGHTKEGYEERVRVMIILSSVLFGLVFTIVFYILLVILTLIVKKVSKWHEKIDIIRLEQKK